MENPKKVRYKGKIWTFGGFHPMKFPGLKTEFFAVLEDPTSTEKNKLIETTHFSKLLTEKAVQIVR